MKRIIAIIILVTMCLTFSNNVFGEEAYPVTWIRDDYRTTIFKEGMLLVYKSKANNNGYEYGFLDQKGKEAVPLIYDDAQGFSEGLAAVRKDGKCGYVDKTGKVIIPFVYDSAWSFSDGFARVIKDKKWYYIDKTGKNVIGPLDYEEVSDFKNGFATIESYYTYGLIDKKGKVVVPLKYQSIQDFHEGLAIVSDWDSNGKRRYGAINTAGKLIIPIVYNHIGEFNDGVANATKNYKCGVIDRNGKVIVQFKYSNIECFNNGLAQVIDGTDLYNHKYAFINKTGKFVIPFSYNKYDYQFSDGLAAIEIKDKVTNKVKVGFVNTAGKMVIQPKYGDMTTGPQHTFRNGFAIVSKGDDYTNAKYGIIDKTGKEIVPIIYDSVGDYSSGMYSFYNDGLAIVSKDGKVGAVDPTGKTVIPMIFDSMQEFSNGVTLGQIGGRTCIIEKPLKKAAASSYTVVLIGREISL
ncbi:MAG: hypothetical protein K0S61_4636 [Anaerocolumna sp.]|nr:hypothetical protein [Anaerocolumna sp.]